MYLHLCPLIPETERLLPTKSRAILPWVIKRVIGKRYANDSHQRAGMERVLLQLCFWNCFTIVAYLVFILPSILHGRLQTGFTLLLGLGFDHNI